MFLARKITRAKWETKNGDLADGEIAADAVTADLRTQGNSLSFWQCGTGAEKEVEDVALAMAAAGTRIDNLDIVWCSVDELQTDGQTLRDTEGRTPVTDLAGRHVDVCYLDYVRLGSVARRIAAAIADQRYRRLRKRHVANLLVAAVKQRRVELAALESGVRLEVSKSLEAEK